MSPLALTKPESKVGTFEVESGTSDGKTMTQSPAKDNRSLSAVKRWKRRSPLLFWLSVAFIVLLLLLAIILGAVFGTRAHKNRAVTQAAPTITVNLTYAQYESAQPSNGIRKWLGIRYAAAPVGDLRFRAPQDPSVVSGVQQAVNHGPICIGTDAGVSEDCLFLDVYAPTTATALPVFVFLQGGGFSTNSNPNYDGTGLIKASNNSMIVVTLGYRVSLYGFLAGEEVVENGNVNNGLLDQRKALEWVQKYISLFGGDPGHVTIGGDSAGGASVALHVTAYGGRDDGLFHATFAESPSFANQFNVSQAQYQYDALSKRAGCDTVVDSLKCLRNLTTAELDAININIKAPGDTTGPPLYMYSNVIDGNFTTDYTYKLLSQGSIVRVPSIWGADTNDGTTFTPTGTANVSAMNSFLRNNFPKLTDKQLSQIDDYYPEAGQYSGKGAFFSATAAAYGDMRYKCPSTTLSSTYANASMPVWTYRYNVINDPTNGMGTGHTPEVNAIWGPSYVSKTAPNTYLAGGSNVGIVPIVQGYWTSFIVSKNPNTYRYEGSPTWEEWTASSKARIVLQTNTTTMETVGDDEQTHCSYFTSIGLALQQ